MTKTAFMGGSLSFKGEGKKKKAKKKKSKSKHSMEDKEKEAAAAAAILQEEEEEEELTEAEKKAKKRKLERERAELELAASKSHRDRIEEFNEKLGNLTEHNDIPRVSVFYVIVVVILSRRFMEADCENEKRRRHNSLFAHKIVCITFTLQTGECGWKRLSGGVELPALLCKLYWRDDHYFIRSVKYLSCERSLLNALSHSFY